MTNLGSEFYTDTIPNKKGWLLWTAMLLSPFAGWLVCLALTWAGVPEKVVIWPGVIVTIVLFSFLPVLVFGHEQNKVLRERRLRLYQRDVVKRIGHRLNVMKPEDLEKLWALLYPHSTLSLVGEDKHGNIYEITPVEDD